MDLLRAAIGGVELREVDWADKLTGQDRINFLKYCSEVASSPFFPMVVNALIWKNIAKAGTVAETIEEVFNDRAAVNGISMVAEYFQKYALIYKDEFEPELEEPPQKNTAFSKVGA